MVEISEDVDLAYALSLQEELEQEQEKEKSSYNFAKSSASSSSKVAAPISVVDDSWELIDPIPDVRQLFLQFNDTYFKGLLGSVEVRWSPRMTLCAGLCCYEGRGGLCSIRLSQPLLKLRPRKDLVQTLLHEMIHALLFVTQNNKVNVYRQHWWKCDGLCRKRPPYYGMVKRAMNRAPSPRDTWWADHQKTCGGTYTKIKEPENYGAKKTKSKQGKEKSDSETEMAKGKGQGNETGTLPKFFKRKKVDSDDDSSDLDNNRETGKKRKKGSFEDSDKATSITGGVVKSNISQPGSSHWTADVIPFSGSGRTLGSNSAGNITGAEPQSGLQDSSRTLNKKTNGTKKSIIVIKTPSPAKPKKTPSPTLTILDAFQRAKDKNKDCKNRSDDFKSPVLGSQRKPIELGDSPSPVIREVASTTGSPDSVQCPVCQALVLNSRVNQHLDSCLE